MSIYVKLAIAAVILLTLLGAAWGIQHEFVSYGKDQYSKGASDQKGADQTAQDELKQAAQGKLLDLTNQVHALTDQLAAAKAAQDVNDAKNSDTVAGLNKRLAAASVWRDPNAKANRCGSGSASPASAGTPGVGAGQTDSADATGVLSGPLRDLLRTDSGLADKVNIAYASCKADYEGLILKLSAPATP